MSMAWSGFIPVQSMIGEDGSLLAIANRAGGIDFWSYAGSKLTHVGEIAIPTPWVSRMNWSDWTVEDDACKDSALDLADIRLRLVGAGGDGRLHLHCQCQTECR